MAEHTYLTGRLRALPPPAAASTPVQPPTTIPCPTTATDPGGELPATALAERVGDFNQSMHPCGNEQELRRRGGHHTCTSQCCLSKDISNYDLRTPHFPPLAVALVTLVCLHEPADSVSAAPCRAGKASPSVSIFARAPVCPDTCRYSRCKPCDVATVHDDHTCYNCEQRQLFPERIPAWELPDLPICDSWCQARHPTMLLP